MHELEKVKGVMDKILEQLRTDEIDKCMLEVVTKHSHCSKDINFESAEYINVILGRSFRSKTEPPNSASVTYILWKYKWINKCFEYPIQDAIIHLRDLITKDNGNFLMLISSKVASNFDGWINYLKNGLDCTKLIDSWILITIWNANKLENTILSKIVQSRSISGIIQIGEVAKGENYALWNRFCLFLCEFRVVNVIFSENLLHEIFYRLFDHSSPIKESESAWKIFNSLSQDNLSKLRSLVHFQIMEGYEPTSALKSIRIWLLLFKACCGYEQYLTIIRKRLSSIGDEYKVSGICALISILLYLAEEEKDPNHPSCSQAQRSTVDLEVVDLIKLAIKSTDNLTCHTFCDNLSLLEENHIQILHDLVLAEFQNKYVRLLSEGFSENDLLKGFDATEIVILPDTSLPWTFKLLSTLEKRVTNNSLVNIDVLLFTPIVKSKENSQFSNDDVLHYLYELVNCFSSQYDEEVQRICIERIDQILELEAVERKEPASVNLTDPRIASFLSHVKISTKSEPVQRFLSPQTVTLLKYSKGNTSRWLLSHIERMTLQLDSLNSLIEAMNIVEEQFKTQILILIVNLMEKNGNWSRYTDIQQVVEALQDLTLKIEIKLRCSNSNIDPSIVDQLFELDPKNLEKMVPLAIPYYGREIMAKLKDLDMESHFKLVFTFLLQLKYENEDMASEATSLFSELIQHSRSNEAHFDVTLKLGRKFVDRFSEEIIPMIKCVKKTFFTETIKSLQNGTRALQIICNHCKTGKYNHLVPSTKKSLEMLLFRVKRLLTDNGLDKAFWLGNLRHRGINGEDAPSQLQI